MFDKFLKYYIVIQLKAKYLLLSSHYMSEKEYKIYISSESLTSDKARVCHTLNYGCFQIECCFKNQQEVNFERFYW